MPTPMVLVKPYPCLFYFCPSFLARKRHGNATIVASNGSPLHHLAYFHVHGTERFRRHCKRIAKSTFFQGVYVLQHYKLCKGPSIKDVCTKSRKIDTLPPLSAKGPHWLKPPPPLSVRTHHKFRKTLSFLEPKTADVRICRTPSPLVRKMSALDKSLSPDCGRLLWNKTMVCGVAINSLIITLILQPARSDVEIGLARTHGNSQTIALAT